MKNDEKYHRKFKKSGILSIYSKFILHLLFNMVFLSMNCICTLGAPFEAEIEQNCSEPFEPELVKTSVGK